LETRPRPARGREFAKIEAKTKFRRHRIVGSTYEEDLGNAILGIDTLWGGDVMCASGTGRFIADSWFSDVPLPPAYTQPLAARVRECGGVSGKAPDREAMDAYLKAVNLPEAIEGIRHEAAGFSGSRREYVNGLVLCIETMWELAMELLGKGAAVPYERCVQASTGSAPEPSDPAAKRERVAQLLGQSGSASDRAKLLDAVAEWRLAHRVPMASVKTFGTAVIAYFDALTARNVVPYLPLDLRDVPRANIEFLPIKDAWFSGSMNYLGRMRHADGSPGYEATYEINASLDISGAGVFTAGEPRGSARARHHIRVSAESVLSRRSRFRGVRAYNDTRAATLFEGIANNAILMAYGVTEVEQLPDVDLQIGALLALLQDDAKNQSSFLTWSEDAAQKDVAKVLRHDYLVTAERADKLSGAWGRHPLLGRMYLPAYRAGTDRVADLRREYPAEKIIPALFGVNDVVDIVTIYDVLTGPEV